MNSLGVTMIAALACSGTAAAAERQIKPFVGVTFAGGTTFVDNEHASGTPHPVIGVTAIRLGEIFGIEADVAHSPRFFQKGDSNLVLDSSVTTVTGNVIVAAPHSRFEYSLRPYLVGGAGLMRVQKQDYFDVFNVADAFAATDVGGGATGFITNRIGLCWEARYFRAISRKLQTNGVSIGDAELSFWRATMAVAIRY
jgi:hypothetical protein